MRGGWGGGSVGRVLACLAPQGAGFHPQHWKQCHKQLGGRGSWRIRSSSFLAIQTGGQPGMHESLSHK